MPVTFSDRLGFMEKETDVANIIEDIEGRLGYNSVVIQAPGIYRLLPGNSLFKLIALRFGKIAKLNSARYIVQFSAEQLERYNNTDKQRHLPEMMSKFRNSKEEDGILTDKKVLGHVATNMLVTPPVNDAY